VDGEPITQAYVQVQTYVKPAYQISVTPDKLAAFSGDPIVFSIDTTFLEGSPVPNLELRYNGSASGTVTTDGAGHASVTVTAGSAGKGYGSSYLTVNPARAEEGEITGEAWVAVYPASLTVQAETNVDENNRGTISGTVYNVDLSRVNGETSHGFQDVIGRPAPSVTVSFDITDVSYTTTEIGEYYDFIAKIVRKRYRYDTVERPLGTFTAVADANGNFEYSFQVDPGRNYDVDMRVTDDRGRTETQQLYLSGSQNQFNFQSSYVYLRRPGTLSSFFGGFEEFALGDPVTLAMYRGPDELPSGGDNRYLFVKEQRGVHGYTVQDSSTYSFEFSEGDIPSVTMVGVWFTGQTYLEVNYGYQVSFKPDERDLNIDITPDKERYAPGDEATLDITVTSNEGNPQGDTEVNVSVVDEALFLIQNAQGSYTPDLLESIYTPVSAGIFRTYASHQYPNDVQAAERGGDGGPRSEFADVAFYGNVTTDGSGHASVSFNLPDNLTSWRVTARGVNAGMMAGTALRKLPVGLPFFADVTMSDEYLVKDKPAIRLRSFGTALQPGTDVTFSVTAPSLGMSAPVEITASAFEPAEVALPQLTEGEHEIVVEARAGSLSDTLVRKVRVVRSRLVTATSHFYELTDGLRLEGGEDGPTRVVFSDHERGRYFGVLQQMAWGYGDRVDQRLARDVSASLLNTYYDEVEVRGEAFDASVYQTTEGGIALFPYAGPDLTLSARMAAIAPDRFGQTKMVQYFLGLLQNRSETRERQLIALYGLAALDEPVLVPLQTSLTESGLTWRERLYAGLGLLEAGDDTNARAAYDALIEQFGEDTAPNYRLRVGEDQDDILEATSLAAILGAGLGDTLAPRLFDYTTANYTTDILVELEQISYLSKALPRLSPKAVSFAYTIDGRRTEVELKRGQSLALLLSPEQLGGLQLETIAGAAGVGTSYSVPADRDSIDVDPDVTVTRSYNKDPSSLQADEVVRISLSVTFGEQALDGCYQLTDLLPSGMRPVIRPYAWGLLNRDYPYRIEGQKVSFCVTNRTTTQIPTMVSYWARVVTTGEYSAEPALIQSMQSARSVNFSEPLGVTIH
jgi:hypothetical protein